MGSQITHKSQLVKSSLISFAKDNPRGLKPDQITADPEFAKLKTSITEHGILEPLIIKPKPPGYVLVDGERRLRAAKQAGIAKVPAIVVKSEADGRVLAYQIHMLRVNWEKAAETKAIKGIVNDLMTKNPGISDSELKKHLMDVTAHRGHEISDLLKLARYDNATIDKVVSRHLNMSYLVQIEASFLTPLQNHYPGIVSDVGEARIRKCMVQKAMRGHLCNTRYLMDKFCVVFKDSDPAHKLPIERLLKTFILKKRSIESALDDYRLINPMAAPDAADKRGGRPVGKSEKARTRKRPRSTATGAAATVFDSALSVSRRQQTSIRDVRKKYDNLAGELSDEETSYISEALYCLEHNCFKAAALMMWSATMSRVWAFAANHLGDFQAANDTMKASPKSFYRYYASGFPAKFAAIDELRERANDMHPLCYVAYKSIISATEFKKLKADHDTRCDCAHPTDIDLSVNKIVDLFENGHDLIFGNKGLK